MSFSSCYGWFILVDAGFALGMGDGMEGDRAVESGSEWPPYLVYLHTHL